jgi:outer membrane murein-binding lipoprotein Lpp
MADDLDLIASGTDGLNDAIDQVSDDLDALRGSASDAAADDVETLEASVDELRDSISTLGGELSSDNLAAVGDAIGEVTAAARAVISTLSDC